MRTRRGKLRARNDRFRIDQPGGLETLEPRLLMSAGLLGIEPEPYIFALESGVGTATYVSDDASNELTISGTPQFFFPERPATPANPPSFFDPGGDMTIKIKVDDAGNLISGVAGPDIVITGTVTVGGKLYTGTLLTGEIIALGWADTSAADRFEFRFSTESVAIVDGVPLLDAAGDIGAAVTLEASTFAGSFGTDWNAVVSKSDVGTIPPLPPEFVSIQGTKFLDLTGNGMSGDDTALLESLLVELYSDVNGNGILDVADGAAIKTTMTSTVDGTYSFIDLDPGKYLVKEIVPDGYVHTGSEVIAVDATTAGVVVTGADFVNFSKDDCKCDLVKVKYLINGCKWVYDLRGNTNEGDNVEVYFYIDDHINEPVQLSLVSYTAPNPYFDASEAHQQEVFDSDTGFFGPGWHKLEVDIPDCNYQIDFICGPVIDQFGPAGSNIFYTPQKRLIAADNDGCNDCKPGDPHGDASISGYVFKDKDNDGYRDDYDPGLAGVLITLTGTDDMGNAVNLQTTTDSDGRYLFGDLRDGVYKVTETQPADYLDGKDSLGSSGGVKSNDMFSEIHLAENENAVNYNFGEVGSSSLSGLVYLDKDKDGKKDYNEEGIGGVKIVLTGRNDLGEVIQVQTHTNADGAYAFLGLRPGVYAITETQPTGYADGDDDAGSLGGYAYNDVIKEICVGTCDAGTGYNFAEEVIKTYEPDPDPCKYDSFKSFLAYLISRYRSWC